MQKFPKVLFIIGFTFFCILPEFCPVNAEYVLPYPSFMPGHKLYKLSRLADHINWFWYWGNLAKAKYTLRTSDKYLVEAKILFEYKQYILARDALNRSDRLLVDIPNYLRNAASEGKDIAIPKNLFYESMEKHIIVLKELKRIVPSEFLWEPENEVSSQLNLHADIDKSIYSRETIVLQTTAL